MPASQTTPAFRAPRSLAELRDELAKLHVLIESDPRRAVQVRESSNALGKMSSTAKTYLEYARISKRAATPEWAAFFEG